MCCERDCWQSLETPRIRACTKSLDEMAKKPAQFRWIIALAIAAFVALLTYSSWQQTRERYEVCMSFNAVTHCATASGSSYDQAVRSAEAIDCQLLTNGRDENMVCLDNPPASVRPVK
jgi:hypothetical protein